MVDFQHCLKELEEKQYFDASQVEDIVNDYTHLMQAEQERKEEYLSTESDFLFLQFLSQDPETWGSVLTSAGAGGALQESQEAQAKAEEDLRAVRSQITELCESASEELEMVKTNIEKLKQKLEYFKKKKAELEGVQTGIQQLDNTIQELESVIADQRQKLTARSREIAALEGQQKNNGQTDDRKFAEQVNSRLESLLQFLDFLNGLEVEIIDEEKIKVDFMSGPSDLTLTLILTLKAGQHGNTKLKNVKWNVDNFNIHKLVEDSIKCNNVVYLIQTVRQLWQHHFPLLSEIDYLIKHHAVDWIQDKGLLRILVGSGTLMFTLKVPPDYPATREITLIDVFGTETPLAENLPSSTDTLKTWVRHLEGMYPV